MNAAVVDTNVLITFLEKSNGFRKEAFSGLG